MSLESNNLQINPKNPKALVHINNQLMYVSTNPTKHKLSHEPWNLCTDDVLDIPLTQILISNMNGRHPESER